MTRRPAVRKIRMAVHTLQNMAEMTLHVVSKRNTARIADTNPNRKPYGPNAHTAQGKRCLLHWHQHASQPRLSCLEFFHGCRLIAFFCSAKPNGCCQRFQAGYWGRCSLCCWSGCGAAFHKKIAMTSIGLDLAVYPPFYWIHHP